MDLGADGVTAAQAVARARSAIGHGCKYGLGKGGMEPSRQWPWNDAMECDCSGFAMWALGASRVLWFDTSRIVSEATNTRPMWEAYPWELAKPGDLIVYGDRRGTDGKVRQGHVGVVSEVNAEGPTLVVHCSGGNWREHSDAIRETVPTVFVLGRAIIARYNRLEAL